MKNKVPGTPLPAPEEGAEGVSLVRAHICDESYDVFLLTALGKAIRFPVPEVRVFKGRESTGVRGINLVRRPSPAFRVQVQTGGKSHVREFSIKRLGVEKAWSQATRFLAECRGYKSTPKAWAQRRPNVRA